MAKYYIGTSGWNYADWRNNFYPKQLPQKNWLEYYATQFNVVEVNATFYRFFNKEIYQHWYERVPKDFKFVVKVPRLISHIKLLKNSKETIKDFEQSVFLLKRKLGLILLQLSPRFPYDITRLAEGLDYFKYTNKVCVEFRHERWLTEEAKELLQEKNSIFCSVDSKQFDLTDWLTSPIGYIRLHGKVKGYHYNYSLQELKQIANFARKLTKQGAKTIYIFFNNDYYAHAPRNALILKELLGC